ncbi:hypothetical protein C8Q77DRAFT_1118818 [Trametes polyzona]|nr:hypothetical protein C8Q77DRAFT_1118818 [Trametes polyzona]
MDILSLPEEVLFQVFRNLDIIDLDICRQVCGLFASLLKASTIRYRISLARSGMVPAGPAGRISSNVGILQLEDYHRSWATAEFVEDAGPGSPVDTQHKCINFSGQAIPFVVGSQLQVYRPASAARGIPSRTWTFELEQIDLNPDYCAVNLAEAVIGVCGFRRDAQGNLLNECRILPLHCSQGGPLCAKQNVVQSIQIPIVDNLFVPTNMQAVISHDLLAWTWRDGRRVYLRVYNWKTGDLLWQWWSHGGILAAFLGESVIAIALHEGEEILAYIIDPNEPMDVPFHTDTGIPPALPPCRYKFMLPPTAERRVRSVRSLSAQVSSDLPDDVPHFAHDPTNTVLSIAIHTHDELEHTHAGAYLSSSTTHTENYDVIVPVRALLAHIKLPHCISGPAGDGNCEDTSPIPWAAWGRRCSRVIPIIPNPDIGTVLMPGTVYASGSKYVHLVRRSEDLALVELFVCDFHPFAKEPDSADDRRRLARHADVSDVVDSGRWKNLEGPVHNTLPFRVLYKSFRLDGEKGPICDRLGITHLADGIAVIQKDSRRELKRTRNILYMLTA